jgi:HK97 family phage prohead protease
MVKEKRTFEVKANESEDMIVEGYAVVFESPETYDYTEVVDRNALNNTDMKDTVLRYNHSEEAFSLARTRNGSLQLNVDDNGLYIRARIIDTQYGRDFYKMIKEGLVDQMSFAFTVTKEEWNDETKTRRILEIDKLYDVSAVDQPFYQATSIFARTLADYEKEYRDKVELEKQKMLLQLELLK